MKRKWCGFDGTAQLDPTDPLFHEMGLAFLEEQDKLFGSYGVYAADPFHESAPPIDTPEYLTGVGQTIHKLFQTFDAGALWVMQAWSMREDIVKAVPKESLLILDLNGSKTAANGGWGYPVIAGNLHNFGGRINMHGDLALLASNQYQKAKARYPNVCGSGLLWRPLSRILFTMNWLLKCPIMLIVFLCRHGLLLMPNVGMERNLLLPEKRGCTCWKVLIVRVRMERKGALL